METAKNRGGYREGAGRKKGRTTTVMRIPDCYQKQIMELIYFLDDEKKKFGGAYEIPVMTSQHTGNKMALTFVIEEYDTERVSLNEIYN